MRASEGEWRPSPGEWWEGVCVILRFCIKRGVCVGQGSVDPRLPVGSDLNFRLRFQTLGRVCSPETLGKALSVSGKIFSESGVPG